LEALPQPLLPFVAAVIRALRHSKHWSQEELAFHVKVEPSEISIIESAKRIPTLWTLQRVAAGLDVELSQLIWQAEMLRRWVDREKGAE